MHCKTCDYPLWGIAGRACPECGTTFRPSEFEFTPSAVRFACPHCATAYFGTSAQGHLIPANFECVQCHRAITMDEMIVTPVGGVTEGSEALPRNIWITRGDAPLLERWWATTKQLLFAPATFARSLPRDARAKDAWVYAFVSFALYTAAASVMAMVLVAAGAPVEPPLIQTLYTDGYQVSMVAQIAGLITSTLVTAFLITPLAIVVTSLLVHFVVMLIAKNRSTLSSTLQTQLYGFGAVSLLSAAGEVPILGGVLSLVVIVWYIVVSSHLVSRVHRTSGFGGFVATIAPSACCCVAFVGMMGVVWYSFFTIVGPVGGGVTIAPQSSLGPALVASRDAAAGGTVADPFTLALGDTAMLQEVVDAVTLGTPDVAIGGVPVADFMNDVPIERREAAIAALAARVPKGDGAFRIGSAVFYYRSDTDGPEGRNGWLVVSMLAGESPVYMVLTEAGETTFEQAGFDAELARVNADRRTRNFPPLPAPDTVSDLADSPVPVAP